LKDLPREYSKALLAAREASKVILQFYEDGFTSEIKSDGSPVTEADLASSKKIHEFLKDTNIPILGEESVHPSYEIRKKWTKSWCVDPLDGTKEFIKKNGEFSICIAMIENSRSIFGVIAYPLKNKLLVGGEGLGAYIIHFDDIELSEKWTELKSKEEKNNPLVVLGSRSYNSNADEFILDLQSKYDKVIFQEKGSALKFFDLAEGIADIYPRFAPTMEWDIAAGHAVLREVGGEIFNLENGLPLVYNKEDLRNPHFIAKTKPML
jgi:3'(2'), 5'-bisphosphate nucleotidase